MEAPMAIPWYAYVFLAAMALGFFVVKVLPTLRDLKRIAGTTPFAKNPKGSSLSSEQIKALSVGAINGEQVSAYIDTLETGMDDARLTKGLGEAWDISDADSAGQTLEWLRTAGHRQYFETVYQILQTQPASEWRAAVESQLPDADHEQVHGFVKNLAETIEDLKNKDHLSPADFERGILAWDMGRLVVVARMAHDKGFLGEGVAWEYVGDALRQCKAVFSSWGELSNSYIIGRAMWSGAGMMLDGLKEIAHDLLEKDGSPWRSLPF